VSVGGPRKRALSAATVTPGKTRAADETRAVALVVGSMVSLQIGTAIAISAFDDAGPLGVVWMRGVIGGALMTLYLRPRLRSYTAEQWRAIVPYGLSLAAFTVFFYLALDRAPLGVVSAIEMLGPLAVAALGRRSRLDFVWIAFAAAGVALLAVAKGVDGHIDALGVAFALAAATGLALYIVFGKQVGQRVDGLGGLATALIITAVVQAPFGVADGGADLLSGSVLAVCAAAGVLSTVIPFSFELIALRTLTIGVFGLLLAFEPAIAALAGFFVRDQSLTGGQIVGIALIVIAGAGVMGPGRLRGRRSMPEEAAADPRVAALARVPLFDDFSADELETVAARSRELRVEPGTAVIRQGESGTDLFLVGEGALDITVDGRVVNTLRAGAFLGELALLFGGPRNATAVAAEAATLYVIGKDDFDALRSDHPRIDGKLLAVVAQRMRGR
jgi:inner membrane transporter RhtA